MYRILQVLVYIVLYIAAFEVPIRYKLHSFFLLEPPSL